MHLDVGVYQPRPDDHLIFTHTVLTTGRCTYDGQDVVVIRAVMGEGKFEFRMTASQAQEVAAALLESARKLEYEDD